MLNLFKLSLFSQGNHLFIHVHMYICMYTWCITQKYLLTAADHRLETVYGCMYVCRYIHTHICRKDIPSYVFQSPGKGLTDKITKKLNYFKKHFLTISS